MKKAFLSITLAIITCVSAQNTTHLSLSFYIDNQDITSQINEIVVAINDSVQKKIITIKSKSNMFDFCDIPFDEKTFLFVEYNKKPFFLTETFMFDMKYLNNPQKDTLFLVFYYYTNPTQGIKWSCRRNEERIQGSASLSYKNEHIIYDYPIFNKKKYFHKNRKFIKKTKRGKDCKFEIKMCKF